MFLYLIMYLCFSSSSIKSICLKSLNFWFTGITVSILSSFHELQTCLIWILAFQLDVNDRKWGKIKPIFNGNEVKCSKNLFHVSFPHLAVSLLNQSISIYSIKLWFKTLFISRNYNHCTVRDNNGFHSQLQIWYLHLITFLMQIL